MHAPGRGRRRAKDGPAAVIGADRLPFDGLVAGEIVAPDEAAGLFHVVDEDVAKRPLIERLFAVVGDIPQRLGIFGLYHALADLERLAVWQIDRRDRLFFWRLPRAPGGAFLRKGRFAILRRG